MVEAVPFCYSFIFWIGWIPFKFKTLATFRSYYTMNNMLCIYCLRGYLDEIGFNLGLSNSYRWFLFLMFKVGIG